jgi:ribosomal protein L32
MEKMLKYKMVNDNKCKRCGEVENFKHLMWDCGEARKIWMAFNEYATRINHQEEKVLEYEDVL